jgi:ankyrin repeat protein
MPGTVGRIDAILDASTRRRGGEGEKIEDIIDSILDASQDTYEQLSFWLSHQKNIDVVRFLTMRRPLYVACGMGDLAKVKELVAAGADTEKTTGAGYSAVHIAVQQGFIGVAKYLHEQGSSIERQTQDGRTPLYMAACSNQKEVVKYLIEAGVDFDKPNSNGDSPFLIAAKKGYLPIVKLLGDAGADMNQACKDGCSPLYVACQEHHLKVVKYLVSTTKEKEYLLSFGTKDGCTAFQMSCQQGHVDIVRYLLSQGVDRNQVPPPPDSCPCSPPPVNLHLLPAIRLTSMVIRPCTWHRRWATLKWRKFSLKPASN